MWSSLKLRRDGRGRLSAMRIVALAFLLMPIGLAVMAAFTEGRFGARPLNDLIHRTGYWALVFVLVALAITPLQRVARWGALADVRRMIGVGAFCYAATHISLFIADQMFDLLKVASEIVLRLYLTIGFIALLGLAALAITSTDAWVRRLGRRWQKLHQAIYVIAVLVLVHFFQQTKADIAVPIFIASLFGWLMGYRLLIWWRKSRNEPPATALLALTVVVAALTFMGEAIGIGIAFHVSPLMVLQMAFDFDWENLDIRPGWLVLAAGLCVVLIDVVRAGRRKPTARGKPAPAPIKPMREVA
jgi:sulfoxide reductase heme-binding subunit YedZ